MRHMIYDGDSFYELDEECLKKKEEEERRKEISWQKERKKKKPDNSLCFGGSKSIG